MVNTLTVQQAVCPFDMCDGDGTRYYPDGSDEKCICLLEKEAEAEIDRMLGK